MRRRFGPAVKGFGRVDGVDPWALHWEALAALARGEDVIILSVGDPDLETPPAVVETAVERLRAGDTHYTETIGRPALRAAVAAMQRERSGAACDVGNVAVLAGTQNGLFAAALCISGPGDEVVSIDPMYTTYPPSIRAGGAALVCVPAPAAAGFRPDLEALEAVVTPRTRAIYVATPNNPTGVVLSEADCDRIADVAARHGLWIVSDEVYAGIADGGRVPSLAARLPDQVITIGSLSKSHAMTGWRIGWMIGPRDLIEHVDDLALCMLYGLPGFIQEGAITALEMRHPVEARMREYCRTRRDLFVDDLKGAPALRVVRPDAGMFALLDVRDTGLSSAAFARGLFDAERVSVLDGALFGRQTDGFVRACFAAEPAVLHEAARRIRRYAEAVAPKP